MSFCNKCIIRNFSELKLKTIDEADEWLCFACDKESLCDFRARHWALINFIKKNEQKFGNNVPSSRLRSETSTLASTNKASKNSSRETKEQKPTAFSEAQVPGTILPSGPPLSVTPSKASKIHSNSTQNRFSPYQPLPPSSYSFTTKGDQIFISVAKYPKTPQGIEKNNLEKKLTDTLELSQFMKNKIKLITETSDFKEAQTDLQIEQQLQRIDLILGYTIEKAQKLKSSIASSLEFLSERRKNVSEEDDETPIVQEIANETIDISSNEED